MATAQPAGMAESRAERAGEAFGRLAVVELQQFLDGPGDCTELSDSDSLRTVAAGVSGMRKVPQRGVTTGRRADTVATC
jgi:hypothetical protein